MVVKSMSSNISLNIVYIWFTIHLNACITTQASLHLGYNVLDSPDVYISDILVSIVYLYLILHYVPMEVSFNIHLRLLYLYLFVIQGHDKYSQKYLKHLFFAKPANYV